MNAITSIAAIGTLVTALAGATSANTANAFLELREEHWFEAMRIGGVDSEILYAIALTESGTSFNGMRPYGPWPWAMNINYESKFYSSREAARHSLAKELEKGNRQIAVGMWQIHLRYNSHYVEDPLDLIDPVTNLYVAARVLEDCGRTYNTTRAVLSCYHSGDVDDAGVAYAERVLKLAKKWGQPFRLRHTPPQVRFAHADSLATPSAPEKPAASPAKVVVVEQQAEVREQKPTISLTMLASAKKPPVTETHRQFLKRIREAADEVPRRVVLVD